MGCVCILDVVSLEANAHNADCPGVPLSNDLDVCTALSSLGIYLH